MDTTRAVALLAACRPVIDRIDASDQGISYMPTADDWPALHGYEEVRNAFAGYEHEATFDHLCQRAGLRPSDPGLLHGVIDQHDLRFPGVAEARLAALKRRFGQSDDT